jgi:cellulose synthase/poly-beta-1,6-N-acetylglucosamine synthase-like glycosyltransferase
MSVVGVVLWTLYLLLALALTVAALQALAWMLYAWTTPDHFERTRFPEPQEPRHSFSLVVPARDEENVLGGTLASLAAAEHPNVEVFAVVGDDDPKTLAVAADWAARRPDRIRLVVDDGPNKSKPQAMNLVLPMCTGDMFGIFDAEDEVHPRLFNHVDTLLQTTGADIVQSGVQLMNYRSSWWALHNVLEYYFYFQSRLHYHAARGFIPLGGNTVFFRTKLLQETGGFDPAVLTEDCDVGVRLSSVGAKTVVAYDPSMATREETPVDLRAFVRQRTRWDQGFLQVLRKREWKQLPTWRRRLLARYTLVQRFLGVAWWALPPIGLTAAAITKPPVIFSLLTYLTLLPLVLQEVVNVVGFGDFCRLFGFKPRFNDYVRLIVGLPGYQMALGVSAIRAWVREARGVRNWEKTEHVGAHRTSPETAP